jgi:hypothetical protein
VPPLSSQLATKSTAKLGSHKKTTEYNFEKNKNLFGLYIAKLMYMRNISSMASHFDIVQIIINTILVQVVQ